MIADLKISQMDFWKKKLKSSTFFCGNDTAAGVQYKDSDFDWTDKETTDDQKRIEDYLTKNHKTVKRVLHVGIGNSSLARKLAAKVSAIVGLSLSDREIARANSFDIRNYYPFKINKYSRLFSTAFEPEFDVIVDNNPNSFACCALHLSRLLNTYGSILSDRGVLLTDTQGLAWSGGGGCDDFTFTPKDWQEMTRESGLATELVTRHIMLSRKAHRGVFRRLRCG